MYRVVDMYVLFYLKVVDMYIQCLTCIFLKVVDMYVYLTFFFSKLLTCIFLVDMYIQGV